jgi:hypothetical protein
MANAALVGTVAATTGLGGLSGLPAGSLLQTAATLLLWSSPLLALGAALCASRMSIVRGLAGEDGYDGLA